MASKRLQKKKALKLEAKRTEPVRVETPKSTPSDNEIYDQRFQKFYDELKWLYCELYQDNPYVMMHLDELTANMKNF